ncbi:cyclin-D3-1-like [Curcuma longa]|uniref:cyclin-D3-1-like n=1 Tax=Curcuma longa TaxID=136217 RepID=UPI003D9F0C36
MGVSCGIASSVLLCPEEGDIALGFDEERDLDGEDERRNLCRFFQGKSGFCRHSSLDFALLSQDCIALLIERESQHLPQEGYAKRLLRKQSAMAVRSDAIALIQKLHAHHNFGPLSAYLSVNYLDRFLSCHELPFQQGKAWMTQLLSVTCLSIAAKVEETELPLSLDLQVGEAKCIFEGRTIQRMELLVLATLKWRMQSVTPFSFIDFFLHQFNGGNSPDRSLISLCVNLISSTVRGVGFVEFKPSEIAAAVALSAMEQTQVPDTDKALASCEYVDKERVLRCQELMVQEMALLQHRPHKNNSAVISSVIRSPIGVLDVSYKSDDTAVGSDAICHHSSPTAKKRKPNSPSGS